jgi:hypothetical protein
MSLVAYLSHPIGDVNDVYIGEENLVNIGKWFNFLVDNTRWAFMCPWLIYTTTSSQDVCGPRALMNQITLLERCDLLVQVGGQPSPRMMIERNHAVRNELPIIDLTHFGHFPGTREAVRKSIAKDLRAQFDQARKMRHRVWLPLLTPEDVTALRSAALTLRADPYSNDARMLIQRIIHAAARTL